MYRARNAHEDSSVHYLNLVYTVVVRSPHRSPALNSDRKPAMPQYDDLSSIADRRESFQRLVTLAVFSTLALVGFFLIGIGSYIAILDYRVPQDSYRSPSIDKYIFIASGVTVILFGAQLAILRVRATDAGDKSDRTP